jgi:hypothetical protein
MARITIATSSLYLLPAREEKLKGYGPSPAVMAALQDRLPEGALVETAQRQYVHRLEERVGDLECETRGLQKLVCELLSKNENLRLKILELAR